MTAARPGAASVQDVRLIELPHHRAETGDLVVMQGLAEVPFPIARVFIVRGEPATVRGQHAHKQCSQFFLCPTANVEVTCDDGRDTASFALDRSNLGLLVPPGIWSSQRYLGAVSILTVVCDRPYEPEDYIRDYEAFGVFRKSTDGAT